MKATDVMKMFGMSLLFTLAVSAFNITGAQEYDDLYFNGNDRKTVKIDKALLKSQQNDVVSSSDYKEIVGTTENFSAKNVNPEYIARYKSAEEEAAATSDTYTGEDYFIEDYEAQKEAYGSSEDDLSSKKYDRQYTRQTAPANTFNPRWSFNTFMGFGAPMMGFSPWGWGPGMGMGFGPSFGWNVSMSWGNGFYNPYNRWNSPWAMYDPWMDPWMDPRFGPGFYNGFYRPYGFAFNPYRFGAFRPWGGWYGMGMPVYVVNGNRYDSDFVYRTANGQRVEYKPRTSARSNSARYVRPQTGASDRIRRVENTSNLRTVSRQRSSDASGRVATDYSRTQNEYYNRTRSTRVRSTRSDLEQSSSQVNRRLMNRTNSGQRDYRSSSMISNRPTRSDSYNRSSGSSYQRSGRSYGSDFNGSRSRSSFSSPSRSSSYGSSGRSYSGSSGRSSSSGSRSSSYSGRGR